MTSAADPLTDVFEAHREHVFGVAYRMLGRVAEAEDVVQDTWLRWRSADLATVRSPRAYLGTVAGRLALDRLRSARHQRETYVGPWLPEPLITSMDGDPAAWSEQADSLTFGFLVVLERLEPLERAVFLLHEVFGYPYAEVATTVDRSEAACRQIAHRARQRVRDEGRPPTVRGVDEVDAADRVAGELVMATMSGDMAAVQRLLAEDIVVRSDGGRDHHAARRPVVGRHRASRLLVNLATRLPADAQVEPVRANGDPAVLVRSPEGAPVLLIAFSVRDEHIEAIHAVVNPDKLAHLA
ncbi:MAG: RNA polymerase sigma-70 factor [uncultured Acidimicrobiales bacterium]|uniref:RNA polymerase sigma-70 factor n=1 Tax=uncultured Acidimicrobiales bacterium TaxID=310071 RepID=A0A6J4IXB2_9ACTN|nr:MAG: RNA polymerase sigma-70 factor [uncultured Acidimicrobiales bacterium]